MKTLLFAVLTSLFILSISSVAANEIDPVSELTSEYSVNCDASQLAGLTMNKLLNVVVAHGMMVFVVAPVVVNDVVMAH